MAQRTHPALVLGAFGLLLWALARGKSDDNSGGGNGSGSPIGELSNGRATLSAATIYAGQPLGLNFEFDYHGPGQAVYLQALSGDTLLADRVYSIPESPTIIPYSQSLGVGLATPGTYPIVARIRGSNGWIYYQENLGQVVVYGPTFSNWVVGLGHAAEPVPEVTPFTLFFVGPVSFPMQISVDYVGPAATLVVRSEVEGRPLCAQDTRIEVPATSVRRHFRWDLDPSLMNCGVQPNDVVTARIWREDTQEVYWQGMLGRLVR